ARGRCPPLLQRAVVRGDRPGAGPVGPGRSRALTAGAGQAGRATRCARFNRDQVMNPSICGDGWEDQLRAGLGRCPEPDFESWRARHSGMFTKPGPPPSRRSIAYRRILMGHSRWIAASLILLLGLFSLYPGGNVGRGAFAETIPGVDGPGTITWTT